jgi:hypothetical protein
MVKFAAALVISSTVFGCATVQDDYALQWSDQSAVLYVHAPNGETIPAFGSQILSVPGYMFSQGAINMHPGKAVIGYDCPQPGGLLILDGMPSVTYVFGAGHTYDLRCNDGVPVVTQRD